MLDSFEDTLEMARALLGGTDGSGDLWEANEYVNRALRLRPADADGWLLKCQIMSAMGDGAAALACADMAIRRAPRSAEVHYWRAASLADMERWADAQKALDRAFGLIDTDDEWLLEDLFYEKAAIFDAIGHRDEAVAAFEAGLLRCPDSEVLKAGLEPLRRANVRQRFKVLPGGRA